MKEPAEFQACTCITACMETVSIFSVMYEASNHAIQAALQLLGSLHRDEGGVIELSPIYTNTAGGNCSDFFFWILI